MTDHGEFMRAALALARRGRGCTSPNPMVGALLVKGASVIGRGWHRRAGAAHAEVEAINDARARGASLRGATLYVTLEPCSTAGRTPPCTNAIVEAGIKRVVVGAIDPNPSHRGRGIQQLSRAGVQVTTGILREEAARLNPAFNHWIVRRTPLVTVKAAMTLDGKTATAAGESKWITGEASRKEAMKLRRESDAILAGVNTIILDDPQLLWRSSSGEPSRESKLRRIVLDPAARTPVEARVVSDDFAHLTTVIAGPRAPQRRVKALEKLVSVWRAPESEGGLDLKWVLKRLGAENVTSLLVEGGGETSAKFFEQRLAQRLAFFYAPIVLGGWDARKGVAGLGAASWREVTRLKEVRWRRVGEDWLLLAEM